MSEFYVVQFYVVQFYLVQFYLVQFYVVQSPHPEELLTRVGKGCKPTRCIQYPKSHMKDVNVTFPYSYFLQVK